MPVSKKILSLLPLVLLPGLAIGQSLFDSYSDVTLDDLAEPDPNEWLMWRRTGDNWAYSPLGQINKDNVGSLRLAWTWTMETGQTGNHTPGS